MKKDERPKLGHFSCPNPYFFDLKFVLNCCWIYRDFLGFRWVLEAKMGFKMNVFRDFLAAF